MKIEVFAGALVPFVNHAVFQSSLGKTVRIGSLVLIALGLLPVVASLQASPRMAMGGFLGLCGAGFIAWTSFRPGPVAPVAAVATAMVIAFVVFEGSVRQVTGPSLIPNISRELIGRIDAGAITIGTWKVDEVALLQVVLASGSKVKFDVLKTLPDANSGMPFVLATTEQDEALQTARYTISLIARPGPPAEFQKLLKKVEKNKPGSSSWRSSQYLIAPSAQTPVKP